MKRTDQDPVSMGSERRRDGRRNGYERRGVLRWDPLRKERRDGRDRRCAQTGP